MHAFWLILSESGKHTARPGESFVGGSDDASVQRRLSNGMGQITRPLGMRSVEAGSCLRALNKLQRFLRNETWLGIPTLSHDECLMGIMTRDGTPFPSPLGLSASWIRTSSKRSANRSAWSVGNSAATRALHRCSMYARGCQISEVRRKGAPVATC